MNETGKGKGDFFYIPGIQYRDFIVKVHLLQKSVVHTIVQMYVKQQQSYAAMCMEIVAAFYCC